MATETVKLDFVHNLRQRMQEQKLMFSYRGEMSHEVMLALLSMTEKKLIMDGSDQHIRSKVFNVMVECIQNVAANYLPSENQKSALFMIGQEDDGYTIYSGQSVTAEKVRELKNNLVKINNMTREELKEFFMVWIQNGPKTSGTDISLGLIDIAKKTGNKLDYDFEPIDEEKYYFSLRTFINHNV